MNKYLNLTFICLIITVAAAIAYPQFSGCAPCDAPPGLMCTLECRTQWEFAVFYGAMWIFGVLAALSFIRYVIQLVVNRRSKALSSK